ncbi:MAG TPA: archease [Methylothermaceae bacterium]|nr:archease [Methylothermaceae bacterium]
MTRAAGWEHFEHMADIGIRGYGRTPAEAFAQAAVAMTAVITNPAKVRPDQKVEIELERDDDGDLEMLLVDFLDAVIYEMAVRKMLFSRFDVTIEDRRLKATLWGEPVDRERHQPAVEIKGATYTELKVTQADDGRWLAQCVLDV